MTLAWELENDTSGPVYFSFPNTSLRASFSFPLAFARILRSAAGSSTRRNCSSASASWRTLSCSSSLIAFSAISISHSKNSSDTRSREYSPAERYSIATLRSSSLRLSRNAAANGANDPGDPPFHSTPRRGEPSLFGCFSVQASRLLFEVKLAPGARRRWVGLENAHPLIDVCSDGDGEQYTPNPIPPDGEGPGIPAAEN